MSPYIQYRLNVLALGKWDLYATMQSEFNMT
jgi:hypothetical protein